MRRKILDPTWFYDFLLNEQHTQLESAKKELREKEVRLTQFIERTRIPGKQSFIDPATNKNTPLTPAIRENCLNGLTDRVKEFNLYVSSASKRLVDLEASKPFLIGPATLDSLLETLPETFEYIENGHIPFNDIFFEFREPLKLGVPFVGIESEARGLLFNKRKIGDKEVYLLDLQYLKDKTKERHTLSTAFDMKRIFLGRMWGSNGGFYSAYEVDPKNNAVRFTSPSSRIAVSRMLANGIYPLGATENQSGVVETKPISEVPNGETLFQIPCLFINLINYINAHNVTVIKKDRPVVYLDKDDRGKKKKHTSSQPFYLITVKDEVVEEPEIPREIGKWQLTERIYVRGHDRRYRDDNGNIRMTTWISPHVKGPPNAPWREQRYQVLAEKLMREKQMMKGHGI
jgi:hypothetical protein